MRRPSTWWPTPLRLPRSSAGNVVYVQDTGLAAQTAARALMTARLRHLPGMIWNGEGPNPYFAFLAGADYILVTEDSTNMATEAASTGKPVFVLKMDGHSLKFRLFHEDGVRVFEALPLNPGCGCDEQRVWAMLASFPLDDLESMRQEDGGITVTCQFCSRVYAFDQARLSELLAPRRH